MEVFTNINKISKPEFSSNEKKKRQSGRDKSSSVWVAKVDIESSLPHFSVIYGKVSIMSTLG